MTELEEFQNRINALWTAKDLSEMFERSQMTIHLWRRQRGLPALVIPGSPRPTIRFDPASVLEWAEREKVNVKPKRKHHFISTPKSLAS